jgi:endonuclease III related protein
VTKQSLSSADLARSLREFYDKLLAAYGPQQWWPAETALEVVVGAYLTQNTSWRAVERSIANLNARGVLHLEGLRSLDEEELRLLIRPSGFMIRKAAAIRAFVAFLDREHGGSLATLAARPTSEIRRQLLALPSVGEETADAILLYALGHPVMVVDEYLRRIVSRHGLAPEGQKYAQLQRFAESAFAHDPAQSLPALANEFHALVVAVGKRHCGRQAKCDGCPLQGL